MSLLALATATCAIALCGLLAAELRGTRGLRAATKTIASLAFIATGLLAWAIGELSVPGFARYRELVVAGLVLGAIGDVALLGKSERAFLGGLLAFLLGHLAYVVAFAQLAPPSAWFEHPAVAVAPIAAGALALAWLWPHLGKLRAPVIAYVLTIIAMVVGALAVAHVPALPARNRWLLAAGAVLFFASDLFVAREKFVAPGFVNRAFGLPTYYAGQLLIAWSIAAGGDR